MSVQFQARAWFTASAEPRNDPADADQAPGVFRACERMA